jgi:hypothetical protein
VPSLATVKDFFTLVFSKSQLESDCIIMALIYCERLVKETKGRLCIRYDNWRSMYVYCGYYYIYIYYIQYVIVYTVSILPTLTISSLYCLSPLSPECSRVW